jgi:hypothetical protein
MVMNEYRRYAADCFRIGDNSTISPEDKIVLTAIAQAWLRLAHRAETDSYAIQKSVDRQPEGQPGERNVRRRPNRTRRWKFAHAFFGRGQHRFDDGLIHAKLSRAGHRSLQTEPSRIARATTHSRQGGPWLLSTLAPLTGLTAADLSGRWHIRDKLSELTGGCGSGG